MSDVYAGKLLRVNLTESTLRPEAIDDADVKQYLLGSGLAAALLMREMDPDLDPLDPASPLMAFNGLLTGTFSPTGCRSTWCGISPLTGIWNESNMGGHWGAELRFSGFDGVIVTGRAAEPVYLWIHEGEAEIRPATHLWGMDHFEVVEQLRRETDPKAQVASIGLAGENQVPLAGVMQGGHDHARTAGRGGMGALMGSKNLKAIVVRGTDKPNYPDPKAFRSHVRDLNKFIQEHAIGLSQLGTPGGVIGTEKFGDMALANWSQGSWQEGAAAISGQRMMETIFDKHTHCFACPIGCGKNIKIEEGPYAGVYGHGAEYETLAGLGGNCQCDDLNAIQAMNDLCNRYGLDTISTSGVLAFAMEALEKGLLSPEQVDGLDLTWGNAEAMIGAIHAIARREGAGKLLGMGVRALAAKLGPEAERMAIHVRGMELPYHDPRAFVSMAANYATASRGACHLEALSYWVGYGLRLEGWFDPPTFDPHDNTGKGKMAAMFQDYLAVYNPLGLCKFIVKGKAGPQHIADLVNAALGWNWTADDVMTTGERLFNLKRLLNARKGVTGQSDTLPYRLLHEPRPSGGAEGVLPDLEAQLTEYYQVRGWSPKGEPTLDRPASLDLAG